MADARRASSVPDVRHDDVSEHNVNVITVKRVQRQRRAFCGLLTHPDQHQQFASRVNRRDLIIHDQCAQVVHSLELSCRHRNQRSGSGGKVRRRHSLTSALPPHSFVRLIR